MLKSITLIILLFIIVAVVTMVKMNILEDFTTTLSYTELAFHKAVRETGTSPLMLALVGRSFPMIVISNIIFLSVVLLCAYLLGKGTAKGKFKEALGYETKKVGKLTVIGFGEVMNRKAFILRPDSRPFEKYLYIPGIKESIRLTALNVSVAIFIISEMFLS